MGGPSRRKNESVKDYKERYNRNIQAVTRAPQQQQQLQQQGSGQTPLVSLNFRGGSTPFLSTVVPAGHLLLLLQVPVHHHQWVTKTLTNAYGTSSSGWQGRHLPAGPVICEFVTDLSMSFMTYTASNMMSKTIEIHQITTLLSSRKASSTLSNLTFVHLSVKNLFKRGNHQIGTQI